MNCVLYIDGKIVETGVYTFESLGLRVQHYFDLDNDVIDLKTFDSNELMNDFLRSLDD